MIEREERVGLIVYLYYNRDAKKLANFGDIIYHSKKHRYLHLYVKQVRISHIKELDQNFVGSLYREQENVII